MWVESESGPFFWRVGKSGGSGPPAAGFAGGASPSRHAPPSRAGRGGALSKGPGDTPDRPWCCCDTTSRRPSEQDTPTKRRCEDPGGPISGRDGGCRWAASTERMNGRRGPARHQERRRQPPRPAPARYAPGRDHERASRTHNAKAQGTPAAPSAATTAAAGGRPARNGRTDGADLRVIRSAAASHHAPHPPDMHPAVITSEQAAPTTQRRKGPQRPHPRPRRRLYAAGTEQSDRRGPARTSGAPPPANSPRHPA